MPKINSAVKNSRVSYKGRDIILDYEFELHDYHLKNEYQKEGLVPVEMYPYQDDIIVGYIPVDERFGVVQLEELIKWADEVLENEYNEE
jgi:hypothetical protein